MRPIRLRKHDAGNESDAGVCLFVYTDGARKGGDGGWAFVAVLNGREVHRDSGKEERTSNNRMELTAILKALAWSHSYTAVDNVIIVTDSQYSITVLTRERDQNRSPYPLPKNHDLIKIGRSLIGPRHKFEWVKGHSGHEWNDFADKLATQAVRDVEAQAVFKPRKRPGGRFGAGTTGNAPKALHGA